MIDIRAILAKSDLFSGLSDASLERVAGHLSEVRFSANEVICREGHAGETMYIIIEGLVSVSSDMGWGQRELAQKGPGEVFGEMALISNDVRSATVRSVTETVCLQLDSENFDALLDKDPLLAQRIAKIMTRRYSSPAMSEFHQPFCLLLNLAVGGGWPGPPDVTTEFPQHLYVDWVRVYQ